MALRDQQQGACRAGGALGPALLRPWLGRGCEERDRAGHRVGGRLRAQRRHVRAGREVPKPLTYPVLQDRGGRGRGLGLEPGSEISPTSLGGDGPVTWA